MLQKKLESQQLVNITFVIALLFTIAYIFHTPVETFVQSANLETAEQNIIQEQAPTVCDKVDILWLAGDRLYWNGWEDKTMFIKPDGTYTRGNVYIREGDEVCIVVLLGPTPAYSPQLETNHLGPKDSVSIFAEGLNTKQTIRLQQHKTQGNAYFAPVRFYHADTYYLRALDEYRSYFWETPIKHAYRPYEFTSENNLIVRKKITDQQITTKVDLSLPSCQYNSTLTGAWVSHSHLVESNYDSLYKMYENAENEVIENDKVFVPNTCQLEYKSDGYGARCLGKKTIHVWGDNNLRRNLKALTFNGASWCNVDEISKIKSKKKQREASRCICNDDHEDNSLYPWISDPYNPIRIDNSWDIDTSIYYNPVYGSLDQLDLVSQMSTFVKNQTHVRNADYVIIGLGNDDIRALQVTPTQFQKRFNSMIDQVRQVYPHQKLIIRTPQYFACGTIRNTQWNAGRSLTFTDVVRQAVSQRSNILLWDVFVLGTDENTCVSEGSSYSKRNVINLENQLLWNLICSDQQ